MTIRAPPKENKKRLTLFTRVCHIGNEEPDLSPWFSVNELSHILGRKRKKKVKKGTYRGKGYRLMNETRLTFGKRLDWTASALVLSSCISCLPPFFTCRYNCIFSFFVWLHATRSLSLSQFFLCRFLVLYWVLSFTILPPTTSFWPEISRLGRLMS